MNAFPTPARLWEPRNVFSLSTITTVSVVQDGWVVTVKQEETFAKETLAKMVGCAQIKKDLIIVHANQATLAPTANSRELLVTVLPVEMVVLALIATMAKILVVVVPPEQRAKLASKTLAMNAPTTLARTVTVSTELETTTAPASLNGAAKIATSMTGPVPGASTNLTAATKSWISTWKNRNVSTMDATRKQEIIAAMKNVTHTPVTTTALTVA